MLFPIFFLVSAVFFVLKGVRQCLHDSLLSLYLVFTVVLIGRRICPCEEIRDIIILLSADDWVWLFDDDLGVTRGVYVIIVIITTWVSTSLDLITKSFEVRWVGDWGYRLVLRVGGSANGCTRIRLLWLYQLLCLIFLCLAKDTKL